MLLNSYMLIWLFITLVITLLVIFNMLESYTSNNHHQNLFEKFILNVENSFYREDASWIDIAFIHISILTLMRFLLDLFSDSNKYFPQLSECFGDLSPLILAMLHILIYSVLSFFFIASGGKLAQTLGKRKKTILENGEEKEVYCFDTFWTLVIIIIYILMFLIFIFV